MPQSDLEKENNDLKKENEELKAQLITLRSEIRSKLEDMNHLEKVLTKARSETLKIKDELDEIERIFELQRKRMREATELWRIAHPGNANVLPDLGALLNWLIKERGKHG